MNPTRALYVPILLPKRAEWSALRNLEPEIATQITPLIEVHHCDIGPGETADARRLRTTLSAVANQIRDNWHGHPPFIDVELMLRDIKIAGNKHPLELLGEEMSAELFAAPFIPVTGLYRDDRYQSEARNLAASFKGGISVRISPTEFRSKNLSRRLTQLMKRVNVAQGDVDLIVDFNAVAEIDDIDFATIAQLPFLNEWRTVILASGSFVTSKKLLRNRMQRIPRKDWRAWRDYCNSRIMETRLPAYGDYTIRYAQYSRPPESSRGSATIVYTSDSEWIVFRGESLRKKKDFEQYPANASLLISLDEFMGSDFSSGDAYIAQKAAQLEADDASDTLESTGNPTTWLEAGFNHHITYVVRQMAT